MKTDNPTEYEKIESIKKCVESYFEKEYSGHDYWHTMRVYRTALYLALEEQADMMTVSLAALLHDVDDIKLSPDTNESLDNALRFMKDSGVEEDVIKRVCQVIRKVSYKGKDSVTADTPEAKCVQDADRLDAMGAIGIARIFSYGGCHDRPIYDPKINPKMDMDAFEYATSMTTSVNHFYEKIFHLRSLMNTKSAQKIAIQRECFMKDYLNEFFNEWNFPAE